MAYYLVTARPKPALLDELREELSRDGFLHLRPFGRALTRSLLDARLRSDGVALWEEEDHCQPPLAEERAAVLDRYFDALEVERVPEGAGWARIHELPRLFPDLPSTRKP